MFRPHRSDPDPRAHEALRERLQWLAVTRRSDPIRFHPRPLRRRLAASAALRLRVRLVAPTSPPIATGG